MGLPKRVRQSTTQHRRQLLRRRHRRPRDCHAAEQIDKPAPPLALYAGKKGFGGGAATQHSITSHSANPRHRAADYLCASGLAASPSPWRYRDCCGTSGLCAPTKSPQYIRWLSCRCSAEQLSRPTRRSNSLQPRLLCPHKQTLMRLAAIPLVTRSRHDRIKHSDAEWPAVHVPRPRQGGR